MTWIDRIEHSILNSKPVCFLRNKSKKIILPGFQKVPLYDVIIFFLSQVKKVGMTERAAAISFNLLMAIPAATIFLCTIIPYLPGISKQVTAELLLLTKDITMNYNTYTAVQHFLEDFLLTPRSGLLSIGFVLAVYYASNAMMCIMRSFNRSLLNKNKRSFFQERVTAIRLTTLLVLLVLGCVILLVTQGVLLNKMQQWFHM
ncbi:MAG TPA: YhjD/YihY/BrkB family envelope integrity protein, partial [Flavitalea sp.]|nr:YhjD/YihY/BrkB family envelope integrity protein [Flavitalea sp.]